MKSKLCKGCKQEKNINDFRIRIINGKEYIYTYCRECERKLCREYSQKNKIKISEYMKEYRRKNIETIKIKEKEYKKKNKEKINEWNKKSHQRNKEKRNAQKRIYSKNNRQKINQYIKEKKESDYIFKFNHTIRNNILQAFKKKGLMKSKHIEEIVGCELIFLYNYLLETFKNNYGIEWDKKEKVHIDHIKPLKCAKSEKEVIKLCHYSNLQLLKAKDNLEKNCKLNWELHS